MNKLFIMMLFVSIVSSAGEVPPEAVRTQNVHSICTTKTSTIRNVPIKLKKLVYAKAGVVYGDRTWCHRGYEVDHIISLWNGGSNDISNLQLQAYCTYEELAKDANGNPFYTGLYDAHNKDGIETTLHYDVCYGRTTPKEAQYKLYNWKN
jgi:hypothetical protein